MIFEKQEYQEQCVSNIMEALSPSGPDSIDATTLRDNLKKIQAEQDIAQRNLARELRLDIMMETGTGKTFTYLQTMYEMNKEWGINKFIIFVPGLAIRAGIMQNIDLTSNYFANEYSIGEDEKRLKKYIYESKKSKKSKVALDQVESYIRNEDEFSVLILTDYSIRDKRADGRVLLRRQENFIYDGKTPLQKIAEMNPVVFIDEPHLLKGEKFIESYNEHFSNSLLLRFGATFPDDDHDRKLSNVIYTLDGPTAFQENLVKKIEVSTLIDGEDVIKFYKSNESHSPLQIYYSKNGRPEKAYLREDVNISTITGDKNHDYHVVNIKNDKVYFDNGKEQNLSVDEYILSDNTISEMIEETIRIHFEKEERLFNLGIKTLSLFFIPNIADFRGDNPRIKNIFEKKYEEQRKEILNKATGKYKEYLGRDYNDEGKLLVHEGYFSGDSGSSTEEKDNYGINLILNEKKKLLSTETSLRFIFSVWALQEGWDNPNIFNICKLASTSKDIKRRQQVGRGLRLSVDNNGVRQTRNACKDDSVFDKNNTLDVIVSRQEHDFIEGLQAEIIGSSITANYLSRSALLKAGLDGSQASHFIVFLEYEGVITFDKSQEENWKIEYPIDDFLENNREKVEQKIKNINYDKILKKFKEALDLPIRSRNNPDDKVGIRAENFAKFKELWEVITSKAEIIYENIDEEMIIDKVKASFDNENIDEVQMQVIKEYYDYEKNEIIKNSKNKGVINFLKPNGYEEFIMDFSKKEPLPLHFCHKMFSVLDKDKIKRNPDKAFKLLSRIVKDVIHSSVIMSVGYKFDTKTAIDARDFFYDTNGQVKKEIDTREISKSSFAEPPPQKKYLYDKTLFDSGIEKDVTKEVFAENDKVIVFAKLPKLNIPTPYKDYNPDFAYFIEKDGEQKIFLIVETKGYDSQGKIPEDEKSKMRYAEKFFDTLNEKFPKVLITYKPRINRESLSDLLARIGENDAG